VLVKIWLQVLEKKGTIQLKTADKGGQAMMASKIDGLVKSIFA